MEELGAKRKTELPLAVFSLVFTAFLCFKWWKVFYCACTGLVFSDVPAHIKLALGHKDVYKRQALHHALSRHI